jgi:hypothetical protein
VLGEHRPGMKVGQGEPASQSAVEASRP